MLDKCYCGFMGKYLGYRFYELFVVRGFYGSRLVF